MLVTHIEMKSYAEKHNSNKLKRLHYHHKCWNKTHWKLEWTCLLNTWKTVQYQFRTSWWNIYSKFTLQGDPSVSKLVLQRTIILLSVRQTDRPVLISFFFSFVLMGDIKTTGSNLYSDDLQCGLATEFPDQKFLLLARFFQFFGLIGKIKNVLSDKHLWRSTYLVPGKCYCWALLCSLWLHLHQVMAMLFNIANRTSFAVLQIFIAVVV